MLPKLISGNIHSDERGQIKFNNEFNAAEIKRIYLIENRDIHFKRGWQGHKVEQRWFSVISGSFEIHLIQIDNWEKPSEDLKPFVFNLNSNKLDFLHVSSGYVSCIQALEENSKLLVLADYLLGEINDEYRFSLEYFKCSSQ